MGVSVAFNYDTWVATFPVFEDTVNQTQANMFFAQAVIIHRNDGGGPVNNATSQLSLLNLVVAHIAQLFIGTDADPANSGVGRVASAGEGSVSATFDYQSSASAEWFNQTKYGAMYWAMMAPYRTMRYLPGRRRVINPFYPFIG